MTKLQDFRRIERAFEQFSTVDPKIQMNTVRVFLEVAKADLKGEAVTNREIENRLGLKSGTTTRNLYYWTEEGHPDNTGKAGFIKVSIDVTDRRQRRIELTPKGKAFINSLIED